MELFENADIYEYTIELIKGKQLLYELIYTLSPVKLVTLKMYIETYLKTRFIWLLNSLTSAPNFFDKKLNGSLYLYVDYRGFNNFKNKNRYPLPLIDKFLDWLDWAMQFT